MKIFSSVCFALLLSALTAHAQVIVSYDFTDAVGNEASWNADSLDLAYVASSSITRGIGIVPNIGGDTFSAREFNSVFDVSDYFSLSLAPANGVTLALNSISFDERRSSTGIRNWILRSSVDGFSSDVASFGVPDDELARTHSVSLSTLGDINNSLEFRFFGFGAEGSSGTWRLDNIALNVVPEPPQYALVFAAGLIIFALIRRLQRI